MDLFDKGLSKVNQGIQKLNQHISQLNDNIKGQASSGPDDSVIKVGHRTCRIEKQLAEGGFGFVYEVTDTSSNHRFALKKQSLQTEGHKWQVRNEVDLWKRISKLGSNNIVRLHDVYYDRDWAFVLSELCPNGTLFDILEKYNGKMQERQIIYILIEICEGLRVMHSLGIAHRDIKLENVLLNGNRFKICDFGSATTATLDPSQNPSSEVDRMIEEFERFTTMIYRPPEMIDRYLKFKVDTQADVWMLGCVAFTLCFAMHPFQDAQKIAILNTQYFMPDEDFDRISVKLRNLVSNMLVPDPAERPTISKVLELLKQWDAYPQVSLSPAAESIRRKNSSGANRPGRQPSQASGTHQKKGDLTAEDLANLQEKIRKEQEAKTRKKQHVPINQQSYYEQRPAQASASKCFPKVSSPTKKRDQKSEQFDFFSFENSQEPTNPEQSAQAFSFEFKSEPKSKQEANSFEFSLGGSQSDQNRPTQSQQPSQASHPGEVDLLNINQPPKPAGDLFTELKDVNFSSTTGSQLSPKTEPSRQPSQPEPQPPCPKQPSSSQVAKDDEIYSFFTFE